jgi:hypothetical protein
MSDVFGEAESSTVSADGLASGKAGAGAAAGLRWFVSRKIRPANKARFNRREILNVIFISLFHYRSMGTSVSWLE